MSSLVADLLAWHASHAHVVRALLAGTLVSLVCGVIGCFIILRRMAFLGDALAHSMLAGVVAGYLFMKLVFGSEAHAPAMLVGSLLAGFGTVALIGFVARLSRIKEDTAIGIMYTGVFAAGGLLASLFSHYVHVDLLHFVTGNVLAVELLDLWMIALVAVFVLAVVILLFRPLQLTSFDPVMAASLGIPVVALDYLLTTCTSLVVVSAVHIVGVILVVGLLVTPAATALLLCHRLSRMLWASAGFAVSSFLVGYGLSSWINVAPGSAIVVTSTLQFLAVLTLAPHHGLVARWWQRRHAVPQRVLEDVLGSVHRDPREWVPLATLSEHVAGGGASLRRAVQLLVRQEFLESAGEQVRLTDPGRLEARRLQRAHRLWETYLERLGTPADDLHRHADQLEHVHDEAAVDYLDDRLGHPLVDPHGAAIPEDFVHLVPGAQVKAALLREGHAARIVAVGPAAAHTSLRPGLRIVAGPRRSGDRMWTVLLPDDEPVLLDHEAADAVLVELDATPLPH
ncbi:MAG: iron chelate uptake ABC transporter family permease subunit [Pirellulales bacterium]